MYCNAWAEYISYSYGYYLQHQKVWSHGLMYAVVRKSGK